MTKQRSILLIYNGKGGSTSAHLFSALGSFIKVRHDCRLSRNNVGGVGARALLAAAADNLARIPILLRADVVVAHSYAMFSLPNLLLARALGKKVVVFQWDVYPSTIAGQRLNSSRLRSMVDALERLATRTASAVVVPSDDFRPFALNSRVHVMPLWPSQAAPMDPSGERGCKQTPDLCFIGQINGLRGLPEAIVQLDLALRHDAVLHVFSADPLPGELEPAKLRRIRIVHHGFLDSRALGERLREFDFGLITLHPQMDQPGFPSKAFEYAAAGLPMLYLGRRLPAFQGLLEETGIGIDLTGCEALDLADVHARMRDRLPEARQDFLVRTSLTWTALEPILFD